MEHFAYRKVVVFIVLCLLLAGGVLFYLFLSGRTLYCSASQPRPRGVESWEKVKICETPPLEPNEAFFDDFVVSSDQNDFIVEYLTERAPDNPFAFEVREMLPGESLNIDGGTLSLCSIGTAYLGAAQTMEEDAVYRFYDTQLREITDERLSEVETFGTTKPGGNFRYSPFPVVALLFEHNGIEDLMFQGIRVFDSSTKKELIGGYSSKGRGAHHQFSTHIPLWHQTPIDVVVEASYGPSKIFEFAPRAGEGFSEGNFQCRLICVFEGVDTYSNSFSRERKVTEEFRKARPGEGRSLFFFACQPVAMKMPVTFEFLDADGNVLRGGGSSTSGFTYHTSVQHSLKEVALIRARYRTRRQRILIHLPYIPGLPEENNTIDDLFDVCIPYVKFQDAGQVGGFLYRILQLNSSGRSGPVPPNSIDSMPFPQEFRNVTVRDIARLYAEGGDLYVDINNDWLRLEYPLPLGERLKKLLQKMLRR